MAQRMDGLRLLRNRTSDITEMSLRDAKRILTIVHRLIPRRWAIYVTSRIRALLSANGEWCRSRCQFGPVTGWTAVLACRTLNVNRNGTDFADAPCSLFSATTRSFQPCPLESYSARLFDFGAAKE